MSAARPPGAGRARARLHRRARRRSRSCASARCSRASPSRARRRPPRSTTSPCRCSASTTATPARPTATRRPTRPCATSPRAPAPRPGPPRAPPASPATTRACPAPAPARPHDGFDDGHGAARPRGGRRRPARRPSSAARPRGCEAFGIWTAGAVDTAIASSTGVRAHDSLTDAFMKVIARHESGRSGWAAGAGSAIAALDPAALAERAAAKVSREEPLELAPGEYPVVLEHDAVGLLLDFLGGLAFDGLAHTEGRGALVGRLGQRVAAPSDQPRRLTAVAEHAAARVRRRGRPQGAAGPHRGRRRPRGRARHALGRAGAARRPPATPSRRPRASGPRRPTSCSPAAARPTRPSSWRRSSAGST